MSTLIRIVGIDPGLRRTGWGIIETLGNSLRFVASGTVTSDDKADLASRLCQIHDGLAEVIHIHRPDEAAVEQTFVNKDATATLKLGQARGIAMLVPARAGLPVAEYAPNEAADPHDAEGVDAEGPVPGQRRRRRARHRHLSRPSHGRSEGTAEGGVGLVCS
jgi:crossover junction endodeoxyribonuclease RuvC